MSHPGTLTWFARHESRLAWRDWVWMMTAGRRRSMTTVVLGLVTFAALMHLLAIPIVRRFASVGADADKTTLVVMTATLLLACCLLIAQGMEALTRAFYSRSDLDLILSSPASARSVFTVRIVTMTLTIAVMSTLLGAPFINVLVAMEGKRWLAGYGVIVAVSLVAMAAAVVLTIALFKLLGPRRTRLATQIVAAVIGAAFVIGLQLAAIQSIGSLSRTEVLMSAEFVALAPAVDSVLYWPARATFGDIGALAAVLVAGLALLGGSIVLFARKLGDCALAASSVSPQSRRQTSSRSFRSTSAGRSLRRKEWLLLRRDPWLVSQSLMQVLYLLPPAFLLWRSYGAGEGALTVLVPILVMSAGQLAGGLAWLAISGEDAPELVATAPVAPRRIVLAKTEAVMGAIALVFLPFVLAIGWPSLWHGVVTALGIAAATAASVQIQLWFRTQASRTHFRRRQTSSRVATFAEAFSSVAWAGTSALAAAESWHAVFAGVGAVSVLLAARLMSPPKP